MATEVKQTLYSLKTQSTKQPFTPDTQLKWLSTWSTLQRSGSKYRPDSKRCLLTSPSNPGRDRAVAVTQNGNSKSLSWLDGVASVEQTRRQARRSPTSRQQAVSSIYPFLFQESQNGPDHCRVLAKSRRPQATLAMILTSPPHSLQVSISILKTRFKRFAQVIARDGMYAGFAGAKTGL